MVYTPNVLIVRNGEGPEWEIFLNEAQNIFIGLEREASMHQPCFTFSKIEWEVIKTFIDNQFKQDGDA